MKPFILTATLNAPISITNPIHLDGLLLWSDYKYFNGPDMGRVMDYLKQKDGIYMASVGLMSYRGLGKVSKSSVPRVSKINLVTDGEMMGVASKPKSRHHAGQMEGSPFGPRLVYPPTYNNVSSLIFIGQGDLERIEEVASQIITMGKMRTSGYGEIYSWSIEEADSDDPLFGWRLDEQIVRSLPITVANDHGLNTRGYAIQHIPVTPPYWDKSDACDCIMPRMNEVIINENDIFERLAI